MVDVCMRAVNSLLTLYMLLILVRWAASWLQLDLFSRAGRWVCRLTDPLITRVRAVLPNLGPVDFAPLVTLIGVWIVRSLALGVLATIAKGV